MGKKYPIDLVEMVYSCIYEEKQVTQNTLAELFEVMYHASLKTEEGEPLNFSIIYGNILSFKESDTFANRLIKPLLFNDYKEYNVKNIIKISKATDIKSSSLIVSNIEGLKICGIYDQEADFYGFLNGTSKQPPIKTGILKASTTSPGQVIVYYKNQKVAEMDCGEIRENGEYIFQKSNRVYRVVERKIERYLNNKKYDQGEFVNKFFEVFCKIILRIRNFKRGGALIFSASDADHLDLGLNYELESKGYSKLLDLISIILRLRKNEEHDKMIIAEKELDKVIWNIALLSKIDGAVLFDDNISVKAFGVKINSEINIPEDKIKKCDSFNTSDLTDFNLKIYGTRHLSMAKYCYNNIGSIGVVISQDSDVRIFVKEGENLIVWENVNFMNFEADENLENNVIENIKEIKSGLRISRLEAAMTGEIPTMKAVDRSYRIT